VAGAPSGHQHGAVARPATPAANRGRDGSRRPPFGVMTLNLP
jgi:hypothetical protein